MLRAEGTHGPVVHAANAAARAAGIAPGARVVDVQAAHPALHVEPADPEGDRAALARMAGWARRWCPWTAPDGADGIVLDLTGSDHLHGGPAATLADIEGRFALLGLSARSAMAPTRGAAWALARHGAGPRPVCPAANLEAGLAPLPVRALRIDPEEARRLAWLGIRTVGALAALPRPALMRRFPPARGGKGDVQKNGHGAGLLIRLDHALGRLPEPVDPAAGPPRFHVRARLPEPVIDAAPHLPALAGRLSDALHREGRGARLLRLTVFRVDGDWRAAEVATAAATREAAHMVRLLAGRLDRIDPGFGFDLLVLEALRTEATGPRQARLGGAEDPESDLAALVDRLTARLGPRAVGWTLWRESHLPERTERVRAAVDGPPPPPPHGAAPLPERPIRLLEPPEEVRVVYGLPDGPPVRFRWRRVAFRVVRREGPERIAPEWWRDRPGTRLRDYWKVEVEDGRRFWIYREGLHGDGRGGDPRWLMHGLFA